MPEIVFDTFTLIGLFVSLGGLTAVIFYNALKIKQNTKSQHYQILKDIYEKYNKIQEIFDDETLFLMNMLNFGLFVKQLIDLKIIPKKHVIQQFRYLFSDSLWILNIMDKKFREEKDTQDFIKFCKDNQIEATDPKLSIRREHYKKKQSNDKHE